MSAAIPHIHAVLAASEGSFLIKPGIGLMVWTLLVFGVTMLLLAFLAFPRISEALGRRQKTIEDSIDSAEHLRQEAEKILADYRARLQAAREQSDEIVARARQAAESHEQEAKAQARQIATDAAERAQREIEAATERALEGIRREVAELTIVATEKVTRKTLDDADQKRLVQEAIGELDFSGLSVGASRN